MTIRREVYAVCDLVKVSDAPDDAPVFHVGDRAVFIIGGTGYGSFVR